MAEGKIDKDNNLRDETLKSLEIVLNRHGYGFQHSLLNFAEDLRTENRSPWLFEATEVPVEVQGKPTHIDFVLKRGKDAGASQNMYMVAECKRANPSVSDWCFIKAPYTTRKGGFSLVSVEGVKFGSENNLLAHTLSRPSGLAGGPYHIALEVKSSSKIGDAGGQRPAAIEEAATQICRGLNGYVEMLDRNRSLLSEGPIFLLPVIFTTANLWISDIDLKSADVSTGNIKLTTDGFKRRDWLLYDYNMSPGLKHSIEQLPSEGHHANTMIAYVMQAEYTRTIPVVNPSGLADFLKWSGDLDLFGW